MCSKTLGPLLSSKGPKEPSTATEGTWPVHSSLSSIQWNPELSVNSLGSWGQYKYFQSILGPLPHVEEGVESSHFAPGSMGPLPLPLELGGHSTFTQEPAGTISSDQ